MENREIVTHMIVSIQTANKYYMRANSILAAYYYGQYIAAFSQLATIDEAWAVADDPTIQYITREDITTMIEIAHTIYTKLFVPAYKDAANN